MTKRISYLLFALALILGSCSKNDTQFTIRGVITHAEGDTIVLEELHTTSLRPVEKAKINQSGEFKITGKTRIPTFYLLKLQDDNFITLLVDSAENIVIKADAANFSREYDVSGSIGSEQVHLLDSKLKETRSKLDSLQSLHDLYDGNPDYDHIRPKTRFFAIAARPL